MAIEFSVRNITNRVNIRSPFSDSITNYRGVRPLDGNKIIGTPTVYRSSSFNSEIISTGGGSKVRNARAVDLGAGNDTFTGFGQGSYIGGAGIDTLKLPKGTYRVRISGSRVTFTKDGIKLTTSGFEKLEAGRKTYDFEDLTNRQKITV